MIRIIIIVICIFVVVFALLIVGLNATTSNRIEVYPRCTLKPMWEIHDYNTVWGKFGMYSHYYIPMSYTDEYTYCINIEE